MASDFRPAKIGCGNRRVTKTPNAIIATAIFGGWTREQLVAHDKRADRIESLLRRLEALTEMGSYEP